MKARTIIVSATFVAVLTAAAAYGADPGTTPASSPGTTTGAPDPFGSSTTPTPPPATTGGGTPTPPPATTGGGTPTPPPATTGGGTPTPPPATTGGTSGTPTTTGSSSPGAPKGGVVTPDDVAGLIDPNEDPVIPGNHTNGAENPYDQPPQMVFGEEVTELQVLNDLGYSVRGRIEALDKDGNPTGKDRNVLWYFTKEGVDTENSLDVDGDGVIDAYYSKDVKSSMYVVIFDFLPQDDYLVAEVRAPKEGRDNPVSIGRVLFKRGSFGGWKALIDTRHQALTGKHVEQRKYIEQLLKRAFWDARNARFHTRVSTIGRSVNRVQFSEKALLEAFVCKFGVQYESLGSPSDIPEPPK